MKRTITQHVEVADEAEYAAAIKYMAGSPWVTDFAWTGASKSLNDLLVAGPDPLVGRWLPKGVQASMSAFAKGKWSSAG